jgi:hypothetical protein
VSVSTLTLTSVSDATWTQTSPAYTAPSGGSRTYTWTFNSVPFGPWTIGLALPANHFGTLTSSTTSGGPALTCGTTSPITCASADLTVPNTGSAALTRNYDLAEEKLDLSVSANALAPDNADSASGLTPMGLTVRAGSSSGAVVFSVSDVAVGGATTIWLPIGTYSESVTTSNPTAWPQPAAKTISLPGSAGQGAISLTEAPAGLTVFVSAPGGSEAATGPSTVTVTCAQSQTQPSGCAGGVSKTAASTTGSVTFSNLAPGDWTVAVTQPGSLTTATTTPISPAPTSPAPSTTTTTTVTVITLTGSGGPVTLSAGVTSTLTVAMS